MSKNIKTAIISLVIAVFFIFDRLLKWLVINSWRRIDLPLVAGWLRLKFAANSGIAFSLPVNSVVIIILTLVIITILTVLVLRSYYVQNIQVLTGCLLIITGAWSNCLDRLYYGVVIDYFDCRFYSVFNLADMLIVCGTIILIYYSLCNSESK